MLVHRSFGRSLNGLGLTLGHHIILNSSPLGQPEIGRAKLTTEHVSKQTSLNESNFPKKEQFPLWFFLNVCITTYVPLLFLLLNLTKLLTILGYYNYLGLSTYASHDHGTVWLCSFDLLSWSKPNLKLIYWCTPKLSELSVIIYLYKKNIVEKREKRGSFEFWKIQ